jgi:hypothetical protein
MMERGVTKITIHPHPEAATRWKGGGYCMARHVHEHGDYCNGPVVIGGLYCQICTCQVRGCKDPASVWWPMLGDSRLCSKHYRKPPPSFVGLVSASQAPPDDFDIPDY